MMTLVFRTREEFCSLIWMKRVKLRGVAGGEGVWVPRRNPLLWRNREFGEMMRQVRWTSGGLRRWIGYITNIEILSLISNQVTNQTTPSRLPSITNSEATLCFYNIKSYLLFFRTYKENVLFRSWLKGFGSPFWSIIRLEYPTSGR